MIYVDSCWSQDIVLYIGYVLLVQDTRISEMNADENIVVPWSVPGLADMLMVGACSCVNKNMISGFFYDLHKSYMEHDISF